MNRNRIQEHLMVHARGAGSMNDAPGVHVGTVDGVEGDFIKLTRNDAPDHQHRWIPMGWVERVDDKAVYLNRTVDEFQQGAMTSNPAMDEAAGAPTGFGVAGGPDSLTSTGGSMFSDSEIAANGARSPMGDRDTTGLRDPNAGGTTDSYTARGTGNTTNDRELMSGAGGNAGQFDARNQFTGGHGNASTQGTGQHVGQGTHTASDGGAQVSQGGVQGTQGYDTSYSGGSSAMPGAGGQVGGSAATPQETANTNLDPALAGSSQDQDALKRAVGERQSDQDDPHRR